jgi:hypothetical protein
MLQEQNLQQRTWERSITRLDISTTLIQGSYQALNESLIRMLRSGVDGKRHPLNGVVSVRSDNPVV